MKQLTTLFALLLLLIVTPMVATSCTDNTDDEKQALEFTTNWKKRNVAYFDSVLTLARQKVAEAQAQYGDDWQSHCEWRVFLSYAKTAGGPSTDTICARVINTGTGTESPLYTDSVKVNYMGHLIPTESYKDGRVFDHSGIYENNDYVFNDNYSTPTTFNVSNRVEGFTTALMHMHVNDRWMVYMSQEMAYKSSASGVMPAYSTLCFDMQLKQIIKK